MDCEVIFTDIYSSFKSLYIVLFPWELRKDITTDFILNRSQRSFLLFVKEFDICPGLLNKSQITKIWNDLIIANEGPIEGAVDLLPEPENEIGQVCKYWRVV